MRDVMEPAVAIPLHFSLEFMGVAAFGALLTWAAESRRLLLSGILGVLLGVQIAHAGAFVTEPHGMRVLAWAAAAAAVAAAIAYRKPDHAGLWATGWTVVVAARVGPALMEPADGVVRMSGGSLALHALAAFGYVLLGVWVWRQAVRSVRLRVVGAFVLVLLVVVMVAGSSVVRVVAANLETEELRRLGLEAVAQQTAFSSRVADIARRSGIVSPAFTRAIASGASAQAVADELRASVFTDLSFVAMVGGGGVTAQSGSVPGDGGLGANPAVRAALAGTPMQSVRGGAGSLVLAAAAPVYRANAPQSADNVIGAAVLGIRYGTDELAQISRATGFGVVILSSDGHPLAASQPALLESDLPRTAVRTIADRAGWSGSLDVSGSRYFGAFAPLPNPTGSQPTSVLLVSPDTALGNTAISVSRALFGAVLAATLIAILIALWFGSRLSRPILDLTEAAHRVQSGDLDATTTVQASDELGDLASTFDTMTASLRSTIAAEQGIRRRLETIVAGMGEGLVAVDTDFTIVSFNPAAEAITGVKAEKAIGRKCHDVYGERTSGPDGTPICGYICPLRDGGGRDTGVAMTGRRGTRLSLAVSCSTLHDEDGNVIGGVDLLRDVTAEMQAEQMKSNFLSNISHELRTPLTPIRGFADVMRRTELPREQRVDYLTEIIQSTNRLERIVAILVDVAAMEAGRLQANRVPVEPMTLVSQAADRWLERSGRHVVGTDVEDDLPAVEADVTLIGRALDELIDNAIKFSPSGGTVSLSATRTRGGVEFAVADEGIGIEDAALAGLFEEFVQADGTETRQFGGLGVGLAFVRRVVEANSGKLDVQTSPGQGSRFSFVLPAGRARRAATTRRPTKPAATKRRRSSPKMGTEPRTRGRGSQKRG